MCNPGNSNGCLSLASSHDFNQATKISGKETEINHIRDTLSTLGRSQSTPSSSCLSLLSGRQEEKKQTQLKASNVQSNRIQTDPTRLMVNHHCRHFVKHDYHDHAHENDNIYVNNKAMRTIGGISISSFSCDEDKNNCGTNQPVHQIKKRKARGGVIISFPQKLHDMLDNIENNDQSLASVVSWQPHGRAFIVHKVQEFVKIVMRRYFQQTKFTSFQRQLNLYGFRRLTHGPDAGSYYNELFLRGRHFLCHKMVRTKIKGTGTKAARSPETEPNFYKMPPVMKITSRGEKLSQNSEQNSSKDQVVIKDSSLHRIQGTSLHSKSASSLKKLENVPLIPCSVIAATDEINSNLNKDCFDCKDVIAFEGQSFHYLPPFSFDFTKKDSIFGNTFKNIATPGIIEEAKLPDYVMSALEGFKGHNVMDNSDLAILQDVLFDQETETIIS